MCVWNWLPVNESPVFKTTKLPPPHHSCSISIVWLCRDSDWTQKKRTRQCMNLMMTLILVSLCEQWESSQESSYNSSEWEGDGVGCIFVAARCSLYICIEKKKTQATLDTNRVRTHVLPIFQMMYPFPHFFALSLFFSHSFSFSLCLWY